MSISKIIWVAGGIVLASIIDLAYMFWTRSDTGSALHKASWKSSGLGRGQYNVLPLKGLKW